MHVPKTAGITLTEALQAAVPEARTVRGLDRALFGVFSAFDTMSPAERDAIYASPERFPPDAQLIMGHISRSTLRAAYPAAQLITVLRDPLTRLLSHWLYWRQHTDAMLEPVGGWAEMVRKSRLPLASFLADPVLAPQTDNMTLRLLLWPDPRLAPDRFIDPADDEALFTDAVACLRDFAFLDVIENPAFRSRLDAWFGRPLSHGRLNETQHVPADFRSPLHREFTAETFGLLAARTRLDDRLWQAIARAVMPGRDLDDLRTKSRLLHMARYGALMAPEVRTSAAA
ncbi:hypothetical protein Acid7E03_43560 [Acidisoma sp. 7E03]